MQRTMTALLREIIRVKPTKVLITKLINSVHCIFVFLNLSDEEKVIERGKLAKFVSI